ncbi:Gfo/Idh/MocA family protein [Pseudoclavibacter sp. 13-3]|uniref:Gfo/Idh/MocA family protein n=1 Tax=Pseudoclavibacter sp. 13-3 TaxID=2901228 RepID=UPI001E61CD94|nr:Gfo/Idh/MocA family oxidoreductase [Pseudoclavibacter sp. 13-3]MCD7101577.1 Gfo/Idh/MocA family oxidoreductase [Pseudoclavibacter sp. 13-3]
MSEARPIEPGRPLGLAVLGAGRIGQVHAATAAALPDIELRCVQDAVPAAAERVAAENGTRAASTLDEVLADDGVDAVVVGTPTPTHLEFVERVVATGRRVLCEKPLHLDLASVDAAARRLGPDAARVMVGFNRRFDPDFVELRRRMGGAAVGEIGPIEQVVITSRDPAPPPQAYLQVSGGIFRDMTIHDFDMARNLVGEIVSVSASGGALFDPGARAAGDLDSAMTTLTAASGVQVLIVNSRRSASGYDQRIEVFGSDGTLRVENHRVSRVRLDTASATDQGAVWEEFFLTRYQAAYRAELQSFAAAVREGVPFSPDFDDGRQALALAVAAQRSCEEGRVVPLREVDAVSAQNGALIREAHV